jgi:hypothetical protein
MIVRTLLATSLSLFGLPVLAVDYKVEKLAEAPPAKAFSASIEKQLAPQGVRISKGTRPQCDVWLTSPWPVKADFKPTAMELYPFNVGELIGAVRYHTKGGDFRNQEIPAGNYTLRYGQQPVDGNHVGTSDTRDFLLLIPADQDPEAKPMAEPTMFQLSPKVSGGTHPAMLSMLRVEGEPGDLPAMRRDEERDLWSVRLAGQAAGGKGNVVIDFVVVGHAPE